MKFRFELRCIADDQEEVHPVASLEREGVAPETLGLTLVEGRAILKTIQEVMIEKPLAHYVESQRRCPDCGAPRPIRGHHQVNLRTAFGNCTVDRPLLVGIDAGFVRARGQQGHFEVITGKSILAFKRDDPEDAPTADARCFAFVQTFDDKPKRRLFELLKSEGMQDNQQVTFLSDGGGDVRNLPLYLNPQAEHLIDWFHITVRLTVMLQAAKGLEETIREGEEQYPLRQPVLETLERIKWYLWHGNVFQALKHIDDLEQDLDVAAFEGAAERPRKLLKAVEEFHSYVDNNRDFIPNYGERFRQGEAISTAFVESTVNQVISKRMVKRQQMQWSQRGAHLLLQCRTRVLNEELEDVFRGWYPQFRTQGARPPPCEADAPGF
ncbi:MAG: ISKra4 family transposase [Chromatiaceae bacterium]